MPGNKKLNLLIFGMQGSGKGTQAQLLAKKYGICHIAPGDIFREEIALKTEIGQKISEYVKSGLLVPDEITISVIKKYIQKSDCQKGFILDGFPRNKIQQAGLVQILIDLNLKISAVIYIDIPSRIVLQRLLGRRICQNCKATFNIYTNPPLNESICDFCKGKLLKRADENKEAIEKRIEIYHNETFPLLEDYKKQNLFYDINGNLDIDEVHNEIVKVIN